MMSSPKSPNASKASLVAKSFLARKHSQKLPTNVDEIANLLGYIQDEFDCVHNNFSGKLYVGPGAIVFVGRIFFFDWSIVIRWENVRQIRKQSSECVRVLASDIEVYDFEKLFDSDRVYSSLMSLHNETIIDTPRKSPTPREVTRGLRRNNSDPLRSSQKFDFNFTEKDNRANAEPVTTDNHQGPTQEKPELEKAWSTIMEDTSSYSETAVQKRELPCDLNAFFDLFLADSAKFSIPAFMKETGEEDVTSSAWKDDANGQSKSRIIEYTHPVNAPMAPPMARARKEQTYKRYDANGIILETRTYVEDVPMTDCFFVAEMIRVERVGKKEVSISMFFDIRFVKSTFFKSIITRTTKGEVSKSLQGLATYIAKNLGQDGVISEAKSPKQNDTPPTLLTSVSSNLLLCLMIFMLTMQLWMLLAMHAMQSDISALKTMCSKQGLGVN